MALVRWTVHRRGLRFEPFPMGTYTVSIPVQRGRLTRGEAIRKAVQVADEEHIYVDGTPSIRVKHAVIPLIGPRREYVVTFPQASRV